eukprot:TRINITY_DN62996_c0_g2_i1.p1 TRINITY_DN62996_c0_g2~~TRINITY_DN62996_c0_g2_i1.p1  ORF type:complete len:227 (+),score=24.00 TRINITY_DN62996_c0_g2_i1:47-727(+)
MSDTIMTTSFPADCPSSPAPKCLTMEYLSQEHLDSDEMWSQSTNTAADSMCLFAVGDSIAATTVSSVYHQCKASFVPPLEMKSNAPFPKVTVPWSSKLNTTDCLYEVVICVTGELETAPVLDRIQADLLLLKALQKKIDNDPEIAKADNDGEPGEHGFLAHFQQLALCRHHDTSLNHPKWVKYIAEPDTHAFSPAKHRLCDWINEAVSKLTTLQQELTYSKSSKAE